LAIAVVLIGLSTAIAVPLALSSHGRSNTAAATSTSSTTDTNGANPTAPDSLVPATGDVPSTHTPTPSTTPTETITRSPTSGSFPALTLEAENADIIQPARAIAYPGASGGRIVIGIGIGTGDDDSGSIQFTNIVIPVTGAYTITIYYLNLTGTTSAAEVTVSRAHALTQTLVGTNSCCSAIALTPMTIEAGAHTITISNQTGPGPGIDKIVISQR
jgi:hypothetical protein